MSTPELRILVVDDDAPLRELVSLGLRAYGADVRVAADGRAALEALADWPPDLMILDVMMPDVDGLEVLETLRMSQDTAELPVVLLSARATDEEIWEGWRAGADYYITKPFKMADLAAFVRSVAPAVPSQALARGAQAKDDTR